jgi:hypothetical protein
MTQNQVKNLSISIVCAFVLGYVLILNVSTIGLAGAALALGGIFLIALVYGKQRSVVEKIDLYVLLSVLGVLAVQYDQLLAAFTAELFTDGFDRDLPLQVAALIMGPLLGVVFNAVAQKKKSLAANIIGKYIGLFLAVWGLSVFFLGRIDLFALTQYIVIFALFGMVAFCRSARIGTVTASVRLSRVSFALAAVFLLLRALFPAFRLSDFNLTAFLNTAVFPWYAVVGLTLLLAAVTGMGFYRGHAKIDEDAVFLSGLVGLIWVIKAAVYFYFAFSWIAVCVYTLLFFGLTNRFIARKKAGRDTPLTASLKDNEFYWLPLAAVGVVVSLALIQAGYLYFWLAFVLGALVVLFVSKNATGWAKDALSWVSLLFSLSGAACMLSLQMGFSAKKLTIIGALFVFASVAMWMLNHKNTIGRNGFKVAKVAMVLVFALLVTVPAAKAGARIDVAFDREGVNAGALVTAESGLTVSVSPVGDGAVRNVRYVWSDTFGYEEDAVELSLLTSLSLPIENSHLILWAEDNYGVVTRKDCWFYDAAREEDYNTDSVFRIGAQN